MLPLQLQDAKMEKIDGTVYFISDCHFGLPNKKESDQRERRVVAFLNSIEQEVTHLFLLGDIFDYWFEYKYVVPKDNIRFLGKLAEMADRGVVIYYLLGNHDMWNFGYLAQEIGMRQLKGIHDFLINDKTVRIGHGDGLDPKDKGYRLIKWIYSRRFNIRWFAALHPRWSFAIANAVSRKSRKAHLEIDKNFLGEDKEPIVQYCKQVLTQTHFDYFVFGHRHYPLEFPLNKTSCYFNCGDWQFSDSYLKMQDGRCILSYFKQDNPIP